MVNVNTFYGRGNTKNQTPNTQHGTTKWISMVSKNIILEIHLNPEYCDYQNKEIREISSWPHHLFFFA